MADASGDRFHKASPVVPLRYGMARVALPNATQRALKR
jgi:hypothetical protein